MGNVFKRGGTLNAETTDADLLPDVLPDLEELGVNGSNLNGSVSVPSESGTELTLQELYRQVVLSGDLIIVIDTISLPLIRKGISNLKSRETAKLKSAQIPADDTVLEFIEHTEIEGQEKLPRGQMKLQIVLKRKQAIKIHKMIIPDGELG